MARRSLIAIACLASLLALAVVWSGLPDARPPPSTAPVTERPNLVVVMGCTLRRDQLGPYGGPADLTPWLSDAAAHGTVFTDTVSASSWTKESSTAIFTGRRAASVGMIDPGPRHSTRVLHDSVTTLAEHLQAQGYWTGGVTANPHLNSTYGLAQGFDAYTDTASTGFSRQDKIHGDKVVAQALAALDARADSDRPFYLRLVLIDPHQPIDIDRSEWSDLQTGDVSARLAKYRAGVARVDRALEQLDRGLKARGHDSRDTVFVLVTDHGEGLHLPVHHRGQHGRVLYPSLTSVPWVLRGPGVAQGHHVDGLSAHEDVLPTLLGVLGLPPLEGLEGRDWSAQVSGNGHTTDRPHAFVDTWYFGASRGAVVSATHACQADWGSTGIKDDTFAEGCFDRRVDPDWSDPAAEPRDLRTALSDWRTELWQSYEQWPHTADAAVRVGDRERQQLQALGYVE